MSSDIAGSHRMKNALIVCGIVAAIVVAVICWVEFSVYIGDGGFDINVTITSKDAIESVAFTAFFKKEDADEALELMWLENKGGPMRDTPFRIGIQSSTRWNDFRLISRSWGKYLVVIGKLYNGKAVGTIVEIPDEANAEVRVELPEYREKLAGVERKSAPLVAR